MSDRRRDVALLAGSLLDLLVVASVWRKNPLSASVGPRALSPHHVVECSRCEGHGVVTDRFRRELECPGCDGKGRFAVDGYTGERVGTVELGTAPARLRSVLCDRCGGDGAVAGKRCPTCDGAGRREWSPFELSAAGDEERADVGGVGLLARPRHLALLYAQGDYELLERALEALRTHDLAGWRLWVGRHVHGYEFDGEPPVDDRIEDAWAFVLARMPAKVRVPGAIRANGRTRQAQLRLIRGQATGKKGLVRRDSEWRRLRRMGVPVREIAEAWNVTVRTVQRVVYADVED